MVSNSGSLEKDVKSARIGITSQCRALVEGVLWLGWNHVEDAEDAEVDADTRSRPSMAL